RPRRQRQPLGIRYRAEVQRHHLRPTWRGHDQARLPALQPQRRGNCHTTGAQGGIRPQRHHEPTQDPRLSDCPPSRPLPISTRIGIMNPDTIFARGTARSRGRCQSPPRWARLETMTMTMTHQHQYTDGSPFPRALGKVVCVGRNYAEPARELNNPVPSEPLLFIKPATAVTPMAEPIHLPRGRGAVHYETEIAVLIGAPLSGVVSDAQASTAIAGIGLALDLTLR